jgi:hypothetical protein
MCQNRGDDFRRHFRTSFDLSQLRHTLGAVDIFVGQWVPQDIDADHRHQQCGAVGHHGLVVSGSFERAHARAIGLIKDCVYLGHGGYRFQSGRFHPIGFADLVVRLTSD